MRVRSPIAALRMPLVDPVPARRQRVGTAIAVPRGHRMLTMARDAA